MKVAVKVIYDGQINEELDEKIHKAISSIGGEWWAQGYSLVDSVRDICFDLNFEED